MAASQRFAASNKAAAEGLIGLANAQFAMFERLMGLNLEATRSAYEDAIAYLRAATSAKGPQDLLALSATATQPAVEKAQAYAREVYDIVAQSQAQITRLFQAQSDALNQSFAGLLDQYSGGAPEGGVAVAALKSMLANANAAYESYNKIARETAELAQANLTAASNGAKATGKKAPAA